MVMGYRHLNGLVKIDPHAGRGLLRSGRLKP
jgi:hypothetical protein